MMMTAVVSDAATFARLSIYKGWAFVLVTALLLAVVEIGRLWETGGGGYIEALRLAAVHMAELMETRLQASAVAAGAWGTARTILLALSFTLGAVLVNPVSKPAFQTPLMQGVMLAALVWAGFGYWNIKDAITAVAD